MIYKLYIPDELLDWLRASFQTITLNRRNDRDSRIVGQLLELGLIEQLPYYGEQICYNPEYKRTGLGSRVQAQYELEQERNEAARKYLENDNVGKCLSLDYK